MAPDNLAIPGFNNLFLIKDGRLEDMGGGIAKVRKTFASLPPPRNELEQFTYNFIGYADEQSGATRERSPFTVLSRVQYDYFLYDDLNLSNIPLFNQDGGRRLNAVTGLSPEGLIIPAVYYWSPETNAIAQNIFTDNLDDGPADFSSPPTIPSFTDYKNYISGGYSSNGLPAEICAESSTMNRWRGNIFERRTRFVIAQ
jgi:hypothetical protein